MASQNEVNEKAEGGDLLHALQATDLTLCFLVCPTDSVGGFLGGVLLTDNRARPKHFAFVQPVKATKLQRILYGSTLDEYIKVDVISQKLWQGLPLKPDVVFVDAPDLLSVRRITQVPTAFLSKTEGSEVNPASELSLNYDTGSQNEDRTFVGEIVASLGRGCSLVEPFDRIRLALTEAIKAGN